MGLDWTYAAYQSAYQWILCLIQVQSYAQYPNGGYPPRYYPWAPQQYNPFMYQQQNMFDPGLYYYEEVLRNLNKQNAQKKTEVENDDLVNMVDNVN